MNWNTDSQQQDIALGLYQFASGPLQGKELALAAEFLPHEQAKNALFEFVAFRVFTVDFMNYSLLQGSERGREISESFFARLFEYTEEQWPGEGGEGIRQRLELYSEAIRRNPGQMDSAIMGTFAKLCGLSDAERFLKAVPDVFLGYLQKVRTLLAG